MAVIGTSFDLDMAIKNQSYAYRCWYNYQKDGNTMCISEADMQKVIQQWSSNITNWEALAEQDVTEYSIEDSEDWNLSYDEGSSAAKEEATKDIVTKNGKTKEGWDGNVKKSKNKNIANGVAAGATAAATAGIAASSATIATAANTGMNAGFWVITCPLVLAVGILYEAMRPNRKENEALKNLKTLMETGQANLLATSAHLEETDLELTGLATASDENKRTTEEEIAAKQELIELAKAAYDAIVARVKAGEPLSPSDKSKLEACKAQIAALQVEIDELQLSSIEFSTANSEAIAAKKGEFDAQALNIAQTKGTTDYAASFDKTTRDVAIVQAVAQGLNVASGTYAAIQAGIFAASTSWLFGSGAWAWAWMAMAIAGAGMSAHGVVEQSIIANQINKELDVRENAEGTIETTTVDYENKLGNMLAQNSFVTEGIQQLESFEQTDVTLESTPTTPPEKSSKKTNNPFVNPEV